MSNPPKPEIYPAMAAIMRDVQAIEKNRHNQSQGFKFRGIDDCYSSLHAVFAAHGVICIPFVESVTRERFANAKGNTVFHTHATVGYRFTAIDGSSIEAKTVGEGMDYADKGTAKCLSAAHKYLLLQTFLIPTQDVEDADAYDPTVDPRERLKEMEEERARAAVMSGSDEPSAKSVTALEEKRRAVAESAAKRPEGEVTQVDCKPIEQKQTEAPAEPDQVKEKKARKPRATKAEEPAIQEPGPVATPAVEEPAAPETNETEAVTDTSAPFETDAAEVVAEENHESASANYVVTILAVPEFKGRKLGDIDNDGLIRIRANWINKHGADRLREKSEAHKAEIDNMLAECDRRGI